MLKLFVLEDDIRQQYRIEDAILKAMKRHSWRMIEPAIFSDPDKLLASITERGAHQVFFLDIQIGDDAENRRGFETATKIRQMDPHATIIFTTTHSEYLPMTFKYKVAALDFIDKGLDTEAYIKRVDAVLETVHSSVGQGIMEDSFTIETSLAAIQVPFHKILYFETSPTVHKVILHTTDEFIEFYARLSQIEKADDRLFKCHKSYVVNPENISKIDKETGTVYFETGDYCYVSKLKMKKLLGQLNIIKFK